MLSSSGYIFLDHNNFLESNELFDNDEAESDEKDQNTQLFSNNMFKIKEKPTNIFEVVKDQIDLHLNIKADIKEIKEVAKKEITENIIIYIDENLDSYVAIHKILTDINDNENLNFDKIRFTQMLFYLIRQLIIVLLQAEMLNATLLYLFKKLNILIESLIRCNIKTRISSKNISPMIILGKAHLKNPHSGPSHVFYVHRGFTQQLLQHMSQI